MTFKSKTDRNIVIILIIFLIIWIIWIALPFLPKKIDYFEYVKADLERRYKTEFVYIRKEADDSAYDGEAYYFYPVNDPNLIVRAVYYKYHGSGTMYIPFSVRKGVADDLEKKIKESVLDGRDTIDLSNVTHGEAIDIVYNIMAEIENRLYDYDIETTQYSSDITLHIIKDNEEHEMNFYAKNRSIISDQLSELKLPNTKSR